MKVNFHCHSSFSDGDQSPENLVGNLEGVHVRYAALTDHDTVEGLARFQEALEKRGITFLSGVELTTQFAGHEVHLLGYGFNPDSQELSATLFSLRQVRDSNVQSIADSLRKMGTYRGVEADKKPVTSVAPDGRLEIEEAIALVHRAGGKTFLAHPMVLEKNFETLDGYLEKLKAMGLDGIEAIYPSHSESDETNLRQLAKKYDLLICAGTDFHSNSNPGAYSYAIEMPRSDWEKFRRAVISGPSFFDENKDPFSGERSTSPQSVQSQSLLKVRSFRRRYFALRILLPTTIAILLFLAAIWGIILPFFQQTLLERKREMIRELTNSAWSILVSYENDERQKIVPRADAQSSAITRIKSLRYGKEGKDYFWIQDMYPRMIMHPYREDLNGQDLTNFRDARNVPIFVEFADLVAREGDGYIDYVWQWLDDPLRLEPKESYVKGFEPWGWIIGTGIYTDDVSKEIARFEQSLINTSLAISGVVILLLLFAVQQSLHIEQKRQEVEDNLRASTERYQSLVEATTEGTLMVLDERCRYANPTFLEMVGYTFKQLEFLDVLDLLPPGMGNQMFWEKIRNSGSELANGEGFEGFLQHANGHSVECIFVLNQIAVAGQPGFILLAKDITAQPDAAAGAGLAQAALAMPVGIFRARAARNGVFLEKNAAACTLTENILCADREQPALADLFSDSAEYDEFFRLLQNEGKVENYRLHVETREATVRFLTLSAQLVSDEHHHPLYIVGILQDVSEAYKQEAGREALIDRLQTSLLFLHEPIERLGRDAVICKLDTPIAKLAAQMTTRNATAALVTSDSATVIGIVTDHDLRARVLAGGVDIHAPVYQIMSSPIAKISEHALVYEALMSMEEKGVRHLAVESENGQIATVVDSKSLFQFQRYGPIVLTREIGRAGTSEEIARFCERTPLLVKTLLDNGARSRHITHMLASVCDTATERLVSMAVEELGPPPTSFAFIGMGSQGRQEQTLLTDQDNGIIFAPVPDAAQAQSVEYFLRLGEKVSSGLSQAGYPLCRGQVMANNPRWVRSLPEWKERFNEWFHQSEAQEIINFSIFFDFRTVYGDAELTHELRRHIHAVIRQEPLFLNQFAHNALLFKPPFRLLGNIYLRSGDTEHAGEINLKDAMMPMVSFARLYALRHQVNPTHTLERIEALCDKNIILPSSRDEIIASYDFLMQLRLQNQLALMQAGKPLNNIIHPAKLGYMQQELLKQAFSQISAIQKKVGYDFFGGA